MPVLVNFSDFFLTNSDLMEFELKKIDCVLCIIDHEICKSYCRVCACVREDIPQALASGLLLAHTQNHTITYSFAPEYIYTLFIARYLMLNIRISMKCVIMVLIAYAQNPPETQMLTYPARREG